MLHEAQEELKNLRNRNYPAGTPRRFHPLGLYPMVRDRVCPSVCVCVCVRACVFVCVYMKSSFSCSQVFALQDSLAAEIEGTMRKELSLDDPECEEQKYVWTIVCDLFYEPCVAQEQTFETVTGQYQMIWYWFLWGFHIAQGMSIHYFDEWTIFIGAFMVPRGWILLTVVILWLYFYCLEVVFVWGIRRSTGWVAMWFCVQGYVQIIMYNIIYYDNFAQPLLILRLKQPSV